ncbi:hypothetical protein CEXT_89071 [Caerostris extrusa]|uniref:Uncharacterized protein n=1 Tax=Caerostris extrusa TaxID=172846 RepID=A0AAV4T2U7_CAEEX|nr:hypothetical protein CEXT_89071 [Caerostris extrusa]
MAPAAPTLHAAIPSFLSMRATESNRSSVAITNRPLTMRTGHALTGVTVLHLHGDGNKTETTDDEDWIWPNWSHCPAFVWGWQ